MFTSLSYFGYRLAHFRATLETDISKLKISCFQMKHNIHDWLQVSYINTTKILETILYFPLRKATVIFGANKGFRIGFSNLTELEICAL
jgi:hypothetical protein